MRLFRDKIFIQYDKGFGGYIWVFILSPLSFCLWCRANCFRNWMVYLWSTITAYWSHQEPPAHLSVNTRPSHLLIMNYMHILVSTTHYGIIPELPTRIASLIYRNITWPLKHLFEGRRRTFIGSMETYFITLRSMFTCVRRLSLHRVSHYEFYVAYPF